MTITVAMALSGLEPDQWNDGLKDIYMQGAILFPKSASTLSLASSGGSSYYSLESGISSMSPDSAIHLLASGELASLDGIVSVEDGGKSDDAMTPVPEHIAAEAEKASITELVTPEKQEDLEEESGVDVEHEMKTEDEPTTETELQDEGVVVAPPPPPPPKLEIMYEGRNLLDLYANIATGWRYTTTYLPDDIRPFYFENRSQYSRLQGGYPPSHLKQVCPDCAFTETIYF